MKKIILTTLTLASSFTFFGQNTFPNSGNVGIGTTSPDSKLVVANGTDAVSISGGGNVTGIGFNREVSGGGIFNSSLSAWQFSARDTKFTLEGYNGAFSNPFTVLASNGYVGLAASSPVERLQVNGKIRTYTTNTSHYLNIYGGSSANFIDSYGTDFYLRSNANNSTSIVLKESGKVGIGTTSPNERLVVNGSIGLNYSNGAAYSGLRRDGVATEYYNGITGVNTNVIHQFTGTDTVIMSMTQGGYVGIGSTNPDSELTVRGKIHCEEVQVDLQVPADYVFEKYYTGASELKEEYNMPTLEEVEAYTKENHHLPNIPSAAEIKEEGLHLKEMTNLLLQKIEELTLYTIEQEKRIKALEAQQTSRK